MLVSISDRFTSPESNRKWVGDITYIKTKLGWVYLAAVMDLYKREVIGYAVSRDINKELVYKALANALRRRGEDKGALIFHSDRGTQYKSIKSGNADRERDHRKYEQGRMAACLYNICCKGYSGHNSFSNIRNCTLCQISLAGRVFLR